MNEPFLLSNLIDLQEIDNKIYKLEIDKKSNNETMIRYIRPKETLIPVCLFKTV